MTSPETRTAWCPNCGEGRASVLTNRCTRCEAVAVPAMTQDGVDEADRARYEAARLPRVSTPDPETTAPVPVPAVAPARGIELPDSPQTHRWLRETERYSDALAEQSAEARATARVFAKKSDELARAAGGLADLVQRLSVHRAPARLPVAQRAPVRAAPGTWSVHGNVCITCGKGAADGVKHVANGRCRSCDGKWRAAGKPAT